MSFLDNSGDIILDAVLTDIGRQRLSQGNFKIGKFAIGDDEIQYNLYDKDHVSGSAYYDLEILQTPVLGAATRAGEIQHGLFSLTGKDILYIPDLALNEKTESSVLRLNKIVHLAVNAETQDKLINQSSVDPKYVLLANATTPGRTIIVESGLNTTDLLATATNRATYLQATNMMDTQYLVATDSRFFNGVLGTGGNARFTNDASGQFMISFGSLNAPKKTQRSSVMMNYVDTSVRGTPNTVYYYSDSRTSDTDKSEFTGPLGTAMAMNLSIANTMASTSTQSRASEWSKFGQLAQIAIDGESQLYDIIDSMVVVRGATTGRSIQIPVRLLRYVSG